MPKGDSHPPDQIPFQAHARGRPARIPLRESGSAPDLPVDHFPWRADLADLGFVRGALYVIRPDGHIAWVDPDADPEALARFVQGLRGLDDAHPRIADDVARLQG